MAAPPPPAPAQPAPPHEGSKFTLPLLAFQHHVGQLYIDPANIQFVRELRQSDLAIVEQGRLRRPDSGKAVNVVCKVWRPFVVSTPQDFRELLLEASKLHRLQHSNLTRFLGLGCFAHGSLAEVRESMFMVEEYVGERTLRKLISEQMRCRHKNLYDARSAVRWASQTASALVALHEQQPAYVHNDVKADNVFLTDTTGWGQQPEAKLGDLKPHRHVYDREDCTLSRHHQQQQRLQSPKAPPPSASLQQPKYTLERSSSGCSSGGDDQQLTWSSSTASSTVAATAAGVASPQQHVHGSARSSFEDRHQQRQQQQLQEPTSDNKQQQQQQRRHPQAILNSSCFVAVGDSSSWPLAASSSEPPPPPAAAAAAATATSTAVESGVAAVGEALPQQDQHSAAGHVAKSLPVPIAARISHGSSKARSCPTDWVSEAAAAGGGPGRRYSDGAAAASAATGTTTPAAGASGSPSGYVSANSSCSFGSASLNTSSSAGGGLLADASSCPSSAPADMLLQHSLSAEIAAADAAAAAAEAAAAAAADGGGAAAGGKAAESEGSGSGRLWRAVSRQRSGASLFLSDSASSAAGVAPSGGKAAASAAGASLAADVDAEDDAVAVDAGVVLDTTTTLPPAAAAVPMSGTKGKGSRRKGGLLATALASAKLDRQQQQGSDVEASLAHQPPQLAADAAEAPASPKQRLLGMLSYKRSKSSPLDDDPQQQQLQEQPQMHLAHSAPDVMHHGSEDVEGAVHHGSLLMPLPLSEPSGLCSLQSVTSAAAASTTKSSSSSGGGGGRVSRSGAVKQQHRAAESSNSMQLMRAHSQPDSSGCVYYGWELLPSGAASPCGAVHSSMLDLFADVAADDLVTSRRYRDSCQYTLVPGSFVQQKAPLSIKAAGPPARSKSLGSWDAAAVASAASSSSLQVAASPGSKWTASALVQLQQQNQQAAADQQQQQLERGPTVGKGYAPSAIESKQHGGNSAFAALTAIDCIAEEGSSIATDSCAPSRESSAHHGTHFYSISEAGGSSSGALSAHQEGHPTPSGGGGGGGGGLPSLLSTESLTKALNLTSLLRHRSSNVSLGGRTSSDSLAVDERQDSGEGGNTTSSQPDSPTGPHSPLGGDNDSSGNTPSKRHLLQLLVTASSAGSDPSMRGVTDGGGSLLPTALDPASDKLSLQQQGSGVLSCGSGAEAAAAADAAPSAAAVAAAVAAAAPPLTKKVRFSLARPQGSTASRDFSLLYAAPELVRGERPTEKVDVFAFGVMLYELLSRRLIASSVAEVCARNNASRRGGRKHHLRPHGSHELLSQASGDAAHSASGSDGGGDLLGEVPEHQMLLTYAQLVAGGYRPPMLPHFPEPVVRLISSCWAAEPYERPRMAEVLQELQSWQKNRQLLSGLNSYVLALADMGYSGGKAKQPSCGSCVIS